MVTTRSKAAAISEAPPEIIESPPRPDRSPPISITAAPITPLLLPPIPSLDPQQQQARRSRKRRREPPPYSPPCTGCAQVQAAVRRQRAAVWCCECQRNYCWDCDERLHDVTNGGLDPFHRPMCSHRVERIIEGGGVTILTPLLELGVLVGLALAASPLLSAASGMLNVDYFFESVCPVVTRARRWVFRLDHALYPILKPILSAWCDTEDAFIKIFVDTWVRGILTATDSYALLIMKAPAAVGALIVIIAVSPIIAMPYAVAATVVRLLELALVPTSWKLVRWVAALIKTIKAVIWFPLRLAAWFCRCTLLGLVMDTDYREYFHQTRPMPPKTGRRLRPTPSHGITDATVGGCTSRVTRIFAYFHRRARRAITGFILTAVLFAVAARLTLLSLDRCGGQGIFTTTAAATIHEALEEMLDPTVDGDEPVATVQPKCVSVHKMARTFARRMGVVIPELESLGKDAKILSSLQEATGNDYIDQTLRFVTIGTVRHLSTYHVFVRYLLCLLVLVVFFAGAVRRIIHWSDLRRRYRSLDRLMNTMGMDDSDDEDDDESSVESGVTDGDGEEKESTTGDQEEAGVEGQNGQNTEDLQEGKEEDIPQGTVEKERVKGVGQ